MTKRSRWTWRMSFPMPWGRALQHHVDPRRLLDLPLAFTQNPLLTPEDFIKRADERGIDLHLEHLLELHHRRALVPLLRVALRPSRSSTTVHVATSAASYTRSPMGFVTAAATQGLLIDPASSPYRPWSGGLPLKTQAGMHRFPSVFYSSYQLLALRPVEQLVHTMSGTRSPAGEVTLNLDPLTRDEATGLDGGRQLAILLTALEMRYLPRIMQTIYDPEAWEKEDSK